MMTLSELPFSLTDRLILIRIAAHSPAAPLIHKLLASQRGRIIMRAAMGSASIDTA